MGTHCKRNRAIYNNYNLTKTCMAHERMLMFFFSAEKIKKQGKRERLFILATLLLPMGIEALCEKLKPILGSKIESLWLEYQLSPESRKEIESIINGLAAKHLDESFEKRKILLTPPPEPLCKGDYPLGTVYYNKKPFYPFCLREYEWIQHIGIFGRTGSGKTNVGFLIVKQLLEKRKPFLIFDWKRNYRDLLYHPEAKDLLLFTVGRNISPFCFNPLIPPKGTSPFVWLKKLIEIMCHVYWLGEGVAYLLQKAIDNVYEHYGFYDKDPKSCPTLLDVKTWLEKYKARGREAQWMDSTLRVIGTLCYGEMGKILNSARPTPIETLLKQNVILELDALTNSDKTFLIECLLLWIHHFRLQEQERETFKHAIIIEEAHHVLLKKKESKETIMDIILREIRELGESIILIDQHPSLISIPSLGNTYCTIAMNLKHARDVNTVGEAMLLDLNEREYLGQLKVGYGIVKLQGRWFRPFLVKFPIVKIKKGAIKDDYVKNLVQGYSASVEDILPDKIEKREISVIPAEDNIKEEQYKKCGITEDEERLLEDVILYPLSGIVSRFKRLSVSGRGGEKFLNSLITFGLIHSSYISTFKGRIRYLEVTEKGKEYLRQKGFDVPPRREGGPEHEYWKHRVADYFKQKGYQIELEKPIGDGKTVDIVISNDGREVAVEIETGKSDAVENIRKGLEARFDKIFCIAISTHIQSQIEQELKVEGLNLERVKVTVVKDLMDQK